MIQPDMNAVKTLIKAGEIPLMQLKKSSHGDLEVEVVRCAPYTRYTAISHVVSTIHGWPLLITLPNSGSYSGLITVSGPPKIHYLPAKSSI